MLVPVGNGECARNDLKRQSEEPLKAIASSVSTLSKPLRSKTSPEQIGKGFKTYFHPIEKPQEGSKNRVEKAENEPAIGKITHSSASDCMV